jgi:ABC-2 type transport system permease protein
MLRQLWTMTASDLRQRVRDKSVVIFGLVVPLALMYVFNLVFGGAEQLELEPTTVVAATPAADARADAVVAALQEGDFGDFELTVEQAAASEVRGLVDDGGADLGLILPDGIGRAVESGSPVTVEAVEGDGHEVENQVVLSVVDGVLQRFAVSAQAASAAAATGVPPEELAAVARTAVEDAPAYTVQPGAALPEQLDAAGALVAGQTGLFLLFTVGFGVLGLVLERESGTLARLRSMPMPPWLVVAAKALGSFLLGVGATTVLLTVGGLLFEVSFGSLPLVALLVVAVVAAATSLMFVIVRVARTSEQAGIAQSIVAVVLGISGGAFFPINAPGALGAALDLNPVAAFTRGLGVTAGGGGLGDIGVPLLVMVGFAAVMVLLSTVIPDRGAAA